MELRETGIVTYSTEGDGDVTYGTEGDGEVTYGTGGDGDVTLLCFKIISHQAPIYLSELLHLYTPPGSSALLQKPECSECHPSEQSPVVSAPSLTRLQLSGTNSLFLSAILPLSALLNLP